MKSTGKRGGWKDWLLMGVLFVVMLSPATMLFNFRLGLILTASLIGLGAIAGTILIKPRGGLGSSHHYEHPGNRVRDQKEDVYDELGGRIVFRKRGRGAWRFGKFW